MRRDDAAGIEPRTSGRRTTALKNVKRLVFRPIPSTRAVQAAMVKPAGRAGCGKRNRTSCSRPSSQDGNPDRRASSRAQA